MRKWYVNIGHPFSCFSRSVLTSSVMNEVAAVDLANMQMGSSAQLVIAEQVGILC